VAADPQALALGIFQSAPHRTIPGFLSVGLPVLLDGVRPPLRRCPPGPGRAHGGGAGGASVFAGGNRGTPPLGGGQRPGGVRARLRRV